MSRRSRSPTPPTDSARLAKRPRLDFMPLTPEDYKDGVMLAPMVRSGALPTRLYALKHGANLVWGPEIVDKAILHSERVVDPVTGVVSYNGKSKAIFTTHPIEKPYLIYQIGSADPELAVQAAKTVMNDVAGIDLNCGCPKPFSTHAGMGAALLTNPDLLCNILTALRSALPPEISVSCKIRLLPTQEDTLKLVERIVNTGVNALTVHCRTRNMRPREKALIERLREIVNFVEGMGRGIAIIENGDCVGYEDAKRIRDITGAHSAMIATAAEANPSCFFPTPLVDVEKDFVPAYVRLCKYLGHHWSVTKFCATQFHGAHSAITKAEATGLKQILTKAKGFDDMNELCEPWSRGEEEFAEIVKAIEARGPGRRPKFQLEDEKWKELGERRKESEIKNKENPPIVSSITSASQESQSPTEPETAEVTPDQDILKTPQVSSGLSNPALLRAPLLPANELKLPLPPAVSGKDADTPTPTPRPPALTKNASEMSVLNL